MAPHSSTLARRIPWAEEPGGLPSMGSHSQGVSGPSSSCVWNPRVFADDARADSMDVSLSELWELVMDMGAWHAAIHATLLSLCSRACRDQEGRRGSEKAVPGVHVLPREFLTLEPEAEDVAAAIKAWVNVKGHM